MFPQWVTIGSFLVAVASAVFAFRDLTNRDDSPGPFGCLMYILSRAVLSFISVYSVLFVFNLAYHMIVKYW